MPDLVTRQYVQDNFPKWGHYADNDEPTLDRFIDRAEEEFAEYVTTSSAEISAQLKLHILNIVRYRLFSKLYGDRSFEAKPQIVKDYEATIKTLEQYRSGALPTAPDPTSESSRMSITAKARFIGGDGGSWFNNTEG